jgi:hypothetical protein
MSTKKTSTSTMVQQSTHNLTTEASNPATGASKEKMPKSDFCTGGSGWDCWQWKIIPSISPGTNFISLFWVVISPLAYRAYDISEKKARKIKAQLATEEFAQGLNIELCSSKILCCIIGLVC